LGTTSTPLPRASNPIPLEGEYSFSWVEEANKTTGAYSVQTGSLSIKISPDGLMQGIFGGNELNGKVKSDGTWSASMSLAGYRFKGNINDGELSGTYTAQPNPLAKDTTQCGGTVTGSKKIL
jgi:hypothetical protein